MGINFFTVMKFFPWRVIDMRFYLSHSIRGKAGLKANHDIQAKNCAEAIRVADYLRKQFPKLELYVPAEHETFIQLAYDNGYLNIEQILRVDRQIIDNCDGVLIYAPPGDELQGGRLVEYEHAIITCKPVVVFHETYEAVNWLTAMYRKELL